MKLVSIITVLITGAGLNKPLHSDSHYKKQYNPYILRASLSIRSYHSCVGDSKREIVLHLFLYYQQIKSGKTVLEDCFDE